VNTRAATAAATAVVRKRLGDLANIHSSFDPGKTTANALRRRALAGLNLFLVQSADERRVRLTSSHGHIVRRHDRRPHRLQRNRGSGSGITYP
jgi:hypothetical protein